MSALQNLKLSSCKITNSNPMRLLDEMLFVSTIPLINRIRFDEQLILQFLFTFKTKLQVNFLLTTYNLLFIFLFINFSSLFYKKNNYLLEYNKCYTFIKLLKYIYEDIGMYKYRRENQIFIIIHII